MISMKEKAVLLTDNGKKAASFSSDMFKIMGTGVAGLFSSLKDALTDPLVYYHYDSKSS